MRRFNTRVNITSIMPITAAQKKYLRSKAHHLKPVVIVGQHGLGESVLAEIDQALMAHELIKVKISAADRKEKAHMIDNICTESKADHVQTIGNVGIIFRRNPKKPKIDFPSS